MTLAFLAAGAIAATALATAPAPDVELTGRAQTGPDSRDVRFTFACSQNDGPNLTGALSVELAIPGYEQLDPAFSFDALEGPSANAGPLTRIEAHGAHGSAQGTFDVSGWIGVETTPTFHLGLNAAMRNDAPRLAALAKLLRTVTMGSGQLVWRQGNPAQGGVPMVATLTITATDAARLLPVLRPCLAAANRGA